MAGRAAIPIKSLRRSGDFRPGLISSDMSTPFLFMDTRLVRRASLGSCGARIRKIAYVAPQNSDVDSGMGIAGNFFANSEELGEWQGDSG
jgi:hypothetical protein